LNIYSLFSFPFCSFSGTLSELRLLGLLLTFHLLFLVISLNFPSIS
jgi:hypothetical protein